MKIFIVCTLISSCVFAHSVINAFEAPDNASGLAWDGNYLWCGAYGVNGDTIFKLDPNDGTILKKLRWGQSVDSYGLTFDQGDLWVNDHLTGTDSIFRIDTITGARITALPAHKEYMAGLANDGTNLWHCLYYSPDGRAYYIDKTNGSALDSIDIFTLPQPWGAAWDGEYLWVCNDGNYGGSHSIYKIDVVTKQIVDSLESPGERPWGLTWDGSYLWVVAQGTSPTGHVAYQIDLEGGGTPDIEVSPMSYDFGILPFDSSASFTLNIANVGDTILRVDSIYTQHPVFTVPLWTYPFDISEGADTTIVVTFSPDTNLYYSSHVVVACSDPDEETTYVSVQGRGVHPDPTLIPSATSHNYGNVHINCVKDWFLKMRNEGYPMLMIDSMTFDNAQFFTPQAFPVTVECLDTVEVQIITQATVLGNYNGLLYIHSNDPTSPYEIQLSATGDSVLFQAGDVLWTSNFPDNVVCVSGVSDINGDGIDDVAAESYGTDTDGSHLKVFWGNSSYQGVMQWGFGDDTTTGSWGDDCLIQGDDYNGDAIPDIILGTAWGDRSVYAIDAASGTVIWYYDSHWFDGEGGWVYSVRPMPDINGDDVGEVLAGIGGHGGGTAGPRSMYCFSGVDGTIVWRLQAQDAVGSVNWIEDVNGDDVPDAICGAWGNFLDQQVYCVSGASSGVVYTPIWSYDCGGDVQSVIAIPDVDGDGIQDVVAGAWSDSVYCLSGVNGARIWATNVGGLVIKVVAIPHLIAADIPGIGVAHLGSAFHVLNASTGEVYWTYPIGSNVWTVDAIEDVDGDGKYDVLTGNQNPGTVYCFSGDDGSIIWSYNEGRLIYSVRAVSDISFDGYQDVLVGTQKSGGVARLLALCGGTPVPGVAENVTEQQIRVFVYPKISAHNFTIGYSGLNIKSISIYDASGRLVKSYNRLRGDANTLIWHAEDNNGRVVSQGIYFIRIENDDYVQTEKVILVR
ncbi:MAG: PQQ-binding-like beta-propeller repeat protein [candidate division WOR-3 bacterium]|nr:MAG: PQQ-binding-like beta-propeller repeat protein [candidate division WOR-3 bacterium]